ncbi:hypothetical protein MBRA1_002395 [Malassezia brasiliensis]|uniref:Amine oxidase domain-containing protein n=1 Tax=Malassezia brasiliensis TaxID=1821822 RepID=A0AAF0DVV7_9BASI|nr:hypothetical protein MBRA1_002395 [Malassezia brasiliensis]
MTLTGSPDVRVAVVGSGLAGLTTAYYLAQTPPDKGRCVHVDLFERQPKLGMDAESISVERDGKEVRVDVPMRSFSEGYYPELLALYRSLGIQFRTSRFTFAFSSCAKHAETAKRQHGPDPVLLYNGRRQNRKVHLYPPPTGLSGHMRAWFSFLRIAVSYVLLNMLAMYHSYFQHTTKPDHALAQLTFQAWCRQTCLSRRFTDDLLFPLFASIMTTDLEAVEQLPAAEMLEYIARTFFSLHYTVAGGVQLVVEALAKPISADHIYLGTTIVDLVPHQGEDGVRRIMVRAKMQDDTLRDFAPYDHIVFATQCTQTAQLLGLYERHLGPMHDADLTRCQQVRDAFTQMRYEQSTVVCHTDTTILPSDRALWRDLNLVSAENDVQGPRYTMATHIVCRGDASSQTVMQTTNPLSWLFPDADCILRKSFFERFVLTLPGRNARRAFFQHAPSRRDADPYENARKQLRLGPLQGRPASKADMERLPGIWLTGSWSFGVPLLEGTPEH